MNFELSIILALDDTDNDEEKIKKSIESALSQNYEKTGILICADCPSKETQNLLSDFEKSSDRVKVYYTSERRGKGGAYNLGLRKTSENESEEGFISFMNCGDTVDPSFAKKLIDKAKENNADIVACRDNTDESGTDAEIFKEALGLDVNDMRAILTVNSGRMESKIYKRKIFEKNGLWFPENLLFEKTGILRLALLCAESFEYLDEDLYFFDKDTGKDIRENDLYDRLDVMSYFIEECYKREFLEEYPEEVESAFIDEMYMKTLFTYVAVTVKSKRKKEFLMMLREAISDCFPEFETNPYYYEKYDDDIKDLVSLHMENPSGFLKAVKKITPPEI